MHAFHVFRWPATSRTVNVGHGSITNHMTLWRELPISGAWHSRTLVEFGQRWARDQLRRCAR